MKFSLFLIYICWSVGGAYCDIDDIINSQLHASKQSWDLMNYLPESTINEAVEFYAPVSGDYDNDLCRNHSRVYRKNLKNQTPWALRMFDSGSKIPGGLIMGNFFDLGNFDECLNVENVETDYGLFSGKHCLVNLLPSGEKFPENPMDRFLLAEKQSIVSQKENRSLSFLPSHMTVSVCVPSSCAASDVEAHFQESLPIFSVNVEEITCNSRVNITSYSTLDLFAMTLLIFSAALVVLSTSYDLISTNSENRHDILVAYSVYTNGNTLLNGPAGKDLLPAVHGIRFLSCMWVVLGHRYTVQVATPSVNLISKIYMILDWNHLFLVNAPLSVDSFLFLSGLLVCYNFLKNMESGKKFNMFNYYSQRFIRLTPSFAVMILLTMSLFSYLGEGPIWKIGLEYEKSICMKSWWSSLLYISNYFHPDDMCFGHSWYLSVDMQLFWISPLILLPLWNYPKFGKILLGFLFGIGLVVAFLIPYIYQFDADIIPSRLENRIYYLPTHTRFMPWLIGVGLGYILHKTKHRDIHMSPFVVTLGWVVATGLLMTTFLLRFRFTHPGHEYERFLESAYLCLNRPAWALGLAWVMFACVKGYGGFVNTFLSWRFFLVLGRFTYTIYLVHVPIQLMLGVAAKSPIYSNDFIMIYHFFGDVVMSLAFAVILSLVFETPAIVLQKQYSESLKKRIRPKKKNVD